MYFVITSNQKKKLKTKPLDFKKSQVNYKCYKICTFAGCLCVSVSAMNEKEAQDQLEQKEHLLTPNSTSPPEGSSLAPPTVEAGQPSGEKNGLDAKPSSSGLTNVSTSVSGFDGQVEIGERRSRSTTPVGSLTRGRSRSPTGGSSATFRDIPQRSRSPTPTRSPSHLMGQSPARNHLGGGGGGPHCQFNLSPPAITYDEVNTAPNSPTGQGNILLQDIRMYGSSHQLQNKAVMVTPSGSLLAVNQSPLELRESTLSVNYPDMGGKVAHSNLVSLL